MFNLTFTQNPSSELKKALDDFLPHKIFILCDENTTKFCLPILHGAYTKATKILTIKSGEQNKNLETVQKIWTFLILNKADRHSVLVNIGGGVITDMGGFAASTFKRGIHFINVPTTLLAQTDASIGGKTGIDFKNLKNEIGLFAEPDKVILSTLFLKTLSKEEFLSGFAEMIKHGMIFDKLHLKKLFDFYDKYENKLQDNDQIENLVKESVKIKAHFVSHDPTEKGIRKALNFGHTFGHAIESFFMKKENQVKHGYAVAYGMICELYLSNELLNFSLQDFLYSANKITEIYGDIYIEKKDSNALYALMKHDKKNNSNNINCTLIDGIGEVKINVKLNKLLIFAALNYYIGINF